MSEITPPSQPRPLRSILVRRTNRFSTAAPLDIGFLCETMLFYEQAVLLADGVIMRQLIKVAGIDTLLSLLDTGMLKIHYCPKQFALGDLGPERKNIFQALRIAFIKDLHDIFQEEIYKQVPKLGRSRRLASRLITNLRIVEHPLSIEPAFRAAIQDRSFLKRSLSAWLQTHLEINQSIDFDFDLRVAGEDIQFQTNLNYNSLTPLFQRKVGPDHSLSDSLLLCQLLDTLSNIHLAAEYESEIASDPRSQILDEITVEHATARFNQSQDQIGRFHETVFTDSKDIRSTINSGARTIDEFIQLLEKSRQFRSWLKERPNDIPLVSDYFRAATEQTWIDTLPAKATRWIVFVAAGEAISPIGMAAGATLSAFDAFILDKLIKKWTPHRFIDGEYKRFIQGS